MTENRVTDKDFDKFMTAKEKYGADKTPAELELLVEGETSDMAKNILERKKQLNSFAEKKTDKKTDKKAEGGKTLKRAVPKIDKKLTVIKGQSTFNSNDLIQPVNRELLKKISKILSKDERLKSFADAVSENIGGFTLQSLSDAYNEVKKDMTYNENLVFLNECIKNTLENSEEDTFTKIYQKETKGILHGTYKYDGVLITKVLTDMDLLKSGEKMNGVNWKERIPEKIKEIDEDIFTHPKKLQELKPEVTKRGNLRFGGEKVDLKSLFLPKTKPMSLDIREEPVIEEPPKKKKKNQEEIKEMLGDLDGVDLGDWDSGSSMEAVDTPVDSKPVEERFDDLEGIDLSDW